MKMIEVSIDEDKIRQKMGNVSIIDETMVIEWLQKNCHNGYTYPTEVDLFGDGEMICDFSTVLFEDKKDALQFKLVWG